MFLALGGICVSTPVRAAEPDATDEVGVEGTPSDEETPEAKTSSSGAETPESGAETPSSEVDADPEAEASEDTATDSEAPEPIRPEDELEELGSEPESEPEPEPEAQTPPASTPPESEPTTPAAAPGAASDPGTRSRPPRSGRGMLATGGALLGLSVVGRIVVEAFWGGPADLKASDPFGEWSIPVIAFTTGFPNALVVPGIITTAFGARRYGRWRVEQGRRPADPVRVRRNWRLGWGLTGGGLSLWALTRAVAVPVLRACETNGCAYGYVESTFWLSLGAVVPGVVMVGLAAGERRASPPVSIAPMVGSGARGLALGGRF